VSTVPAITNDAKVAEFLAAAQNEAPIDPWQAQLDIVQRILSAGDIDAVLTQTEAIHAADVLGDVLRVTGYAFGESTFKGNGPAFYMLVECVDADGVPFKVTCGAVNVMAQLYRLGQLNAFPLLARIVESEHETKAGYKPMWLEAVTPDSVPASAPVKDTADF
jgi:hypothetical protein